MSSFHTTSDAAFFSCGEDQTTAWSQPVGHNQQTALASDGSVAGPLAVSTDLFWDMKGLFLTFQSHGLDWIFAPVANDLVNTGVGLSGLEAASTGASKPGYNYSSNFMGQYDPMNVVSIRRLAVDWGSLTYLVTL